MRDSSSLLSSLTLLGCLLTACDASQDRKSENLARGLQTSAPVLAAEDVLLAAEVKSKLVAADFDTAGSVAVSARKGVVTLRGKARTEPEIAHLSDVASQVQGVSSVVTLIKADPRFRGSTEAWRDVSLAAQVSVNLAAQSGVNALSVGAQARDGVVTLNGKVPSGAVKSVMVSAAAKTHGVKKVVDKLRVAGNL